MPRFHIIPTLAVLAATGTLAAADLSDVQFHGFASQGYLYTTDNNWGGRTTDGGTFEVNEFALNATARPVDRLRVGIQLNAYDNVKYGNDKIQLDWAFGEYQLPMPVRWADMSVVAGRFKTGHGLYNDYRDLDISRASVYLPTSVYSGSFRDFFLAYNGFQLNGTLRFGGAGSLDWSGFIGTQNIDSNKGTPLADIFYNGGMININDLSVRRADGGYLNYNSPVDGLRFKGSFLHATDLVATGTGFTVPGFATSTTANVVNEVPTWYSVILSSEYQVNSLTFATEYLMDYWVLDSKISNAGAFPASLLNGTSRRHGRSHGGYGSVTWQFHPKWQFSTNYNAIFYDNHTTGVNDTDHRGASFALRYDPVEHWLIKAEFQRNAGLMQISSADNPAGIESFWWNVFAVKTTFDF